MPEPVHSIAIGTIYGAKTKQGLVEIVITSGEQAMKMQLDLHKAREVLGMLHSAIEAAVSDGLLMKFLTSSKIGLTEAQAGAALLDFRELRQGTRGVAWPS